MSVNNYRGQLIINRSLPTGNDTKRNQSTGNDAARNDNIVRQTIGNQALSPAVNFPLPSARSFL